MDRIDYIEDQLAAKLAGYVPFGTPTPTPVPPPPPPTPTPPPPPPVDDTTPVYPIPADAPRFTGIDLSKLPDVAVLKTGKYTISGKLRPGQRIYSEQVGAAAAVVVLKDGQQVDLRGVSNVGIWGLASDRGGKPARENFNAAWLVGDGSHFEDFAVRKSRGCGVDVCGNGVTTIRLIAEDNEGSGRGGDSCNDYQELHSIIRRNNRVLKDHSGGGGKILKSRNVLIDGMLCTDNTGVGLWFDFNNRGVTVRNCTFGGQVHWEKSGAKYDQYGTGRDLYSEANFDGPTLFEGNEFLGSEGERIAIAESRNVTIRGNKFYALDASPSTRRLAAIAFRDIKRAGTDGKVKGGWLQGVTIAGNAYEAGLQIIRGDGGEGVTLSGAKIVIQEQGNAVKVNVPN